MERTTPLGLSFFEVLEQGFGFVSRYIFVYVGQGGIKTGPF